MTETAQTIKDSLDVITPYLQSLADKLDTTASYLWAMQIKQIYIVVMTDILTILVWFLFAFIGNKIFCKYIKTREDYNIDEFVEGMLLIVGTWIPMLVGILVGLTKINEILTCLLNPEYYALQQLIHMFK